MNDPAAPAEAETDQAISINVAAPVESPAPPEDASTEIPAETAVLASGAALGAATVAAEVAEVAKEATQEAASELSAAVTKLEAVTTELAAQVSSLVALQTMEALEPEAPPEPIPEPEVTVTREPPKKGRTGLGKFLFG